MLCVSCADTFISSGNFVPTLSPYFLRPSKTNFSTWSYKEYSEEFNVVSSRVPWMFTEVPEWLTLTPESSDSSSAVLLYAQENTSADAGRTALFYLESTHPDWEYSKGLSFSQAKANHSLSVEKSNLYFTGAATSEIIKVTANCTWSVSESESWISTECDTKEGNLKVSVSSNESSAYRSATIYISYGTYSYPITIKQSPANITSSTSRLEYKNIASSYTIKINSEATWTSITSDSWINVSPSNGNSGTTEVIIEVSPNTSVSERTGFVSFYIGNNLKLQLEVHQVGLYIKSYTELGFPASASKAELHIDSNTEWEILSAPNWLSFSNTKGVGDAVVIVAATENPNSTPRNGEIVIGQPGLDIDFTISVTQYRKYLQINENVIEFSDKASVDSLKINSNSNWTSRCSDSWFGATPSSGIGDTNVAISVTENLSDTERVGTLQYFYADNSTNVNIHQLAKYLTIDDKAFNFSSLGGTHIIDISTNDSWTAEIEHDVSWLSLSSTSGKGNAQLIIRVEDNPTINIRSTAIIIKSEYAQSIRILISQQARTLSVSSNSILFFSKGGTSDIIHVNTESKYKISCDADWLSINNEEGNTFRVYATKNSNDEFRYTSIKITLTELVDCSLSIEIPVTQTGKGPSFVLNGFDTEQNWNIIDNGNNSLSIVNYTTDKNWNTSNSNNKLTISATGYTTEHDWNLNDKSNGRATITLFGTDLDWNNINNNGEINSSTFDNDNNWNDNNNKGQINHLGFSNDKDWN